MSSTDYINNDNLASLKDFSHLSQNIGYFQERNALNTEELVSKIVETISISEKKNKNILNDKVSEAGIAVIEVQSSEGVDYYMTVLAVERKK